MFKRRRPFQCQAQFPLLHNNRRTILINHDTTNSHNNSKNNENRIKNNQQHQLRNTLKNHRHFLVNHSHNITIQQTQILRKFIQCSSRTLFFIRLQRRVNQSRCSLLVQLMVRIVNTHTQEVTTNPLENKHEYTNYYVNVTEKIKKIEHSVRVTTYLTVLVEQINRKCTQTLRNYVP